MFVPTTPPFEAFSFAFPGVSAALPSSRDEAPRVDVAAAVSPSLRIGAGQPRAYEMKFVLTEAQANRVEELLAPRLTMDPHSVPALGNAYRTTTLYCDTNTFDVLRRVGMHKRRKFRLRRYGSGASIFLERKSKRGERVRKRRSTIHESELTHFAGYQAAADWSGTWFAAQIDRRQLRPALLVHYLRTAWFGATSEGPIRVTFDRDIRGLPTFDWSVAPFDGGSAILPGQVVCEFKFHGVLPASLRSTIEALQLSPCGVSKYRQCAVAAGLAPNGSDPRA
jgi:hypothetical protein